MYLQVVRATTRYWGIHDDEAGAYALQCCGAAAAELEAQGETWSQVDLVGAFAERRKRSWVDVARELVELCQRHSLPPAPLCLRFLAVTAARQEAEAAEFQHGTVDEPIPPEQAVRQLLRVAKKSRAARNEN